jgi:hypothetical protein
MALELEQRLADIDANETVADLMSLFPAEIVEHSTTELVWVLQTGKLRFCSAHLRTPANASGGADWGKVTKIKILAVEAAHG